jgi:hypothetical protein
MARKFQIGDTVEVVKCVNPGEFPLGDWFKVGHRGKVVDYDPDNTPHCYEVRRKNKKYNFFTARELKLIKHKGD